MKKYFMVLLICAALIMSMFTFEAAASMGNSANAAYKGASNWAIPELDKASGYGLITNRIKGNMSGNITREEFAEVIVRFYEIYTGEKAQTGNISFTDTTNPEILKAANLGFIKGVGGNKYDPQRLIAREEMATILFRALKVIIPDEDYSAPGDFKFSDDSMIKSWAKEGVYYCSRVGIIKGIQNAEAGSFRFEAEGNSSREAAVIVCTRAYELFVQDSGQSSWKDNHYQTGDTSDTGDTGDTDVTGNMGDSTGEEWNGGLIINDQEYKKDEYVISEIDGESYIFLPYERYKYPFKMPYNDNYSYPDSNLQNGKITTAWKNKEGEINLEVIMTVDSSVAYLNGQQGDITVSPYYKGDTLYVPINLFIELFSMKVELFQGRLCLQYEDDFPLDMLVGSWSYSNVSIFTGYKNLITGEVSFPSFDCTYVFNADGTYRIGLASSGPYLPPAILFQTGKYKVIGNTVIRYDVYETIYKGRPLVLQYEKKHMGDRLEFDFIYDYDTENDKIRFLNWYNRFESE